MVVLAWQDYEEWEKKQKEERRLQAQVDLKRVAKYDSCHFACASYAKTYLRNNTRMGYGFKFHIFSFSVHKNSTA